MDSSTWLIYLLAVIGLSLSPGPNGLLALTHGALHGQRMALYTITGGVLGFIGVVALAMFGIGALLKTSLMWLVVLKWLGGAYLVWLGIQLWRAPASGVSVGQRATARSGASLFRQGLLAAVSNPKVLLFFSAFLPQFVDPARSLFLQFLVMAGTFAVVELLTELLIAGMANRIAPWLQKTGKRFNQACGGIFMAIGIALPLRG
jgi:threonine/homoserine/homoserine lactone efflux protein